MKTRSETIAALAAQLLTGIAIGQNFAAAAMVDRAYKLAEELYEQGRIRGLYQDAGEPLRMSTNEELAKAQGFEDELRQADRREQEHENRLRALQAENALLRKTLDRAGEAIGWLPNESLADAIKRMLGALRVPKGGPDKPGLWLMRSKDGTNQWCAVDIEDHNAYLPSRRDEEWIGPMGELLPLRPGEE